MKSEEKLLASIKRYEPNAEILAEITCDRFDELHHLITEYRSDKKWDLALACLYKAKTLWQGNETHYQIFRYPEILHLAGYFEEAKFELLELYRDTSLIVTKQTLGNIQHKQAVKQVMKMNLRKDLFDVAARIFKREGLIEEQQQALRVKERYEKLADEANEKLEELNQQSLEEHRKEVQFLEELAVQEKSVSHKNISSNEKKEMIVGFVGIAAIIWAIIHFFF